LNQSDEINVELIQHDLNSSIPNPLAHSTSKMDVMSPKSSEISRDARNTKLKRAGSFDEMVIESEVLEVRK
jgi:hypothetical protein